MRISKNVFSGTITFILPVFFFLCSFSGDENVKCPEIVPFVGIGNIVLGKSKISDVEKTFGKGIKYHEWQESIYVDALKQKLRIINYPNLGLKFIECRPLWLKRFSIQEVYLTDSCKCKTKMGVGIGSKLNDIRREFGPIRVWHIIAGNGEYINVTLDGPKCAMEFNCYSTKDTTRFKAEQIEIYSTD